MRHVHLRKDNTCLNCGSSVPERFCSHCGQENTEPGETFGHLVGHFFADVTHYDSQFFTTIKDLLFRPGFLTNAYNAGKRTSYLNPIRMYVFISALFFIIIFWHREETDRSNLAGKTGGVVNAYRQHLADSLRTVADRVPNLSARDRARDSVYRGLAAQLDTLTNTDTTESAGVSLNNHAVIKFHFAENKYAGLRQYDAAQNKLPATARDGSVARYFNHKMIGLTRERGQREIDIENDISHDVPKLMFVLLPLFAVYVGWFCNRSKFLYSQRVIFSLHFHCFLFICLLALTLLGKISVPDKAAEIIFGVFLLGVFVYLALALHNVFKDARWLAFIKSLAIGLIYLVTLVFSLWILILVRFILL